MRQQTIHAIEQYRIKSVEAYKAATTKREAWDILSRSINMIKLIENLGLAKDY